MFGRLIVCNSWWIR